MKNSIKLLECRECGYKAKQLFQHLKSIHGMTSSQYRKKYGNNCVMQMGFAPPSSPKIDSKLSDQVKQAYIDSDKKLETVEVYSISETKARLLVNDTYKKYFGKTRQRTLMVDDIRLYKSIFHHTAKLQTVLANIKENKNFTDRILFIIEHDANIDNIKCRCGTYRLGNYHRSCKGKLKYPSYDWFVQKYPNTYESEYQIYLNSNRTLGGRAYSKISQELFNYVASKIKNKIQDPIYFAKHNGEWKVTLTKDDRNKANQALYYLDFKLGNKNIEFDSNSGRFPKSDEYVKTRDSILEQKGFKILRVEESAYTKNKSEIIEKCVQFLLNND